MVDHERYVEILKYDMESFLGSLEMMTEEEANQINEYEKYGFTANYHQENIALRNNQILSAIGSHKNDSDFVLKSGTLKILFFDENWYNQVSDMDDRSVACAFNTTEDNVVMFRELDKKLKTFEKPKTI